MTLDPVLKDSHGIPAPRIDYTIGENTRRMMEHGIARASDILRRGGAHNLSCHRDRPQQCPGTCWAPRAWGTIRNGRW